MWPVLDNRDTLCAFLLKIRGLKVSQIKVSNIVKEYPDMIKIVIYREDYYLSKGHSHVRKSIKKAQSKQDFIHRSVRRTRSVISDIILCNRFDLWCTFTFDRRRVNRFDINRCKSVMSMWLHRQQLHSPKMKYLIVPEFHKKCEECIADDVPDCPHDDRPKALHFHALLKNYNGVLKDSHHNKNNRPVFNFSGYRSGFSTAIPMANYQHPTHLITNIRKTPFPHSDQTKDDQYGAISNYIQKYITKDMPLFYGRKRYFCSQGLDRPESFINGVERFGLSKVIWKHKPVFSNGIYELQYHNKSQTKLSRSNEIGLF